MTIQRNVSSDLVEKLVKARRNGYQIHQLEPHLIPRTIADGYAIAEQVSSALEWKPLGWKIAGTTEAVRQKLNISHPIYGRTYQRFAHQSPAKLSHSERLDPLIECEFFVTLAQDLGPRAEPWTYEEVINAIDKVHAGIEVAECRFPTQSIPPLPAVLADGAASGQYIFGNALPQLKTSLSGFDVTVEIDGVERRHGTGRDVMGDPLLPLHWLAETLRLRGLGLSAGEMISTGSCTGMLPVTSGQSVVAHFGTAATVEVSFDD